MCNAIEAIYLGTKKAEYYMSEKNCLEIGGHYYRYGDLMEVKSWHPVTGRPASAWASYHAQHYGICNLCGHTIYSYVDGHGIKHGWDAVKTFPEVIMNDGEIYVGKGAKSHVSR